MKLSQSSGSSITLFGAEALSGWSSMRIDLTDAEVERLAEILDRGFSPPHALHEALSRLADPKRRPPWLHWKERYRGLP